MTVNVLMRGQLRWLRERGAQITVVCSPGAELSEVARREGVAVWPVMMRRAISPVADLVALLRVMWVMHRLRPDVVCAGTPKAGLLGMVAAYLLGVPVRIYTLRGLRLETTRGLTRLLLGAMEGLAATCAQRVVAVSPSLCATAAATGYFPADKLTVLGAGSSNGVDTQRFQRSEAVLARAAAWREKLGILAAEPVIGFVGRMERDKGLYELMEAYDRVRETHPRAWIVFAGPPNEALDAFVHSRERALALGRIEDTPAAYGMFDVLAFPSYREGFPNVPLEAACMELPVLAARATGTVDTVLDGETGVVVPVGDVASLAEGLRCYLDDAALRRRHGEAGRARAVAMFAREQVWQAWHGLFNEMLAQAGRPTLAPTGGTGGQHPAFPG